MRCLRVKKIMSRHTDGALNPDEKKDFDAHIRSCKSCREVLEEMQFIQQAVCLSPEISRTLRIYRKGLGKCGRKRRVAAPDFFSHQGLISPGRTGGPGACGRDHGDHLWEPVPGGKRRPHGAKGHAGNLFSSPVSGSTP